jgi:hypothetical protein
MGFFGAPVRSRKAIVEAFARPSEWSERWWGSAEFYAAVNKYVHPVPSDLLRTSSALNKLREAWAASQFCKIVDKGKSLEVRMEADRFPDFRVRHGLDVRSFELAEALEPNPNIGAEYREAAEREAAGLPPTAKPFDPHVEERAAISKIAEVLGIKAAKAYRPPPHLLIYVNFSVFGPFPLTHWDVEQITAPFRERFPSAWLLWGSSVGRLWPNPCRFTDSATVSD